jgi:hypothetical protein
VGDITDSFIAFLGGIGRGHTITDGKRNAANRKKKIERIEKNIRADGG